MFGFEAPTKGCAVFVVVALGAVLAVAWGITEAVIA